MVIPPAVISRALVFAHKRCCPPPWFRASRRYGCVVPPAVPLFFPVVTALGYDPIWFEILVVIVVQIGMISPPVGMNIFVVKNLIRSVSIADIFRGVTRSRSPSLRCWR